MFNDLFRNMADALREWLTGLGISDGVTGALMGGIGILSVLIFVLLNVIYLIYLERKVSAFIQLRLGPNRVGPRGLFQTVMDAIKLLVKEDIIPKAVDKWVFVGAAAIVFMPIVMTLAVIPWGEGLAPANLNIGVLYFISISSIGTIAFLMAGWGSNNKWSLIGGMRTVAQMISYEIPLAFSILGVVMMVGSFNLTDIAEAQDKVWFIIPQIVAFIIFFIAGTAELNRAPFDMPEAEQELVAGVFTEYTGMRWAMFFLAEYAGMISLSALGATLFLGGYAAPFGLTFIPGYIWLVVKIYFFILMFMWVRWTFPRIRVDHLMAFSWKILIPVSLGNVVLTGLGIYLYRVWGG
ncbi:MAG: dehydrogenase subunit [Paenibacillaceae bacterium]|jgi:NADH-quinone oxidoreductase subunit H|nr:dehydrogenase subunit [Paenibacillaceae bacterium]